MNASSGNQKPSFWDFLLSLFGVLKPSGGDVTPPAQPVIPPDNTTEPVRIETVAGTVGNLQPRHGCSFRHKNHSKHELEQPG